MPTWSWARQGSSVTQHPLILKGGQFQSGTVSGGPSLPVLSGGPGASAFNPSRASAGGRSRKDPQASSTAIGTRRTGALGYRSTPPAAK